MSAVEGRRCGVRTRAAIAIAVAMVAACGGEGRAKPPPARAVDGGVGGDARGAVDAGAALAPIAVPVPPGPYTGPNCQAAFAPRPDRDAAPMCFEPGGEFLMGADPGDAEAWPSERPQRRVTLSPFFIDQFEVTRAQFATFLRESAHGLGCDEIGPSMCEMPVGNSIGRVRWALDVYQDGKLVDWSGVRFTAGALTFAVHPGEERLPMTEVTPMAADAYCAWAGKVLPTNARWEYAARVEPTTGKLRRYVWGDRWKAKLANCWRDDCKDAVALVGAVDLFPGDVSATGVRGLAGNVSEWIRECATKTIPDCGACVDPVGALACEPRPIAGTTNAYDARTSRGGNYLDDVVGMRASARLDSGFLSVHDTHGFRCANDATTGPEGAQRP